MKDNSGNIKQYSAEDIRRYLQDEMSPLEMHAIEKAALDDPFPYTCNVAYGIRS